jgi:hypothetical protein
VDGWLHYDPYVNSDKGKSHPDSVKQFSSSIFGLEIYCNLVSGEEGN